MQLELISFKLCPFVQRAIISLKEQKQDFKITYINLTNPPPWFKEISPTGQVPLLKVNDEVLFESLVITEFIEEISNHSFHPKTALQKAKNRAWIIFTSDILMDMFGIMTGDEEKFNTCKTGLFEKLEKIEAAKGTEKFFNGDTFHMIDAALAPIFMRLKWINEFTNNALSIKQFEKLSHWSEEILSMESVKTSVAEGVDDAYYSNIEAREGFLSTLLVE
jgi:glutathione S-transferase